MISAAAFGGGLSNGQALSQSQLRAESGASQATQAAHRFIYDTTEGLLWFDADGTGARFTPTPIAMLANQSPLGVSAFTVTA